MCFHIKNYECVHCMTVRDICSSLVFIFPFQVHPKTDVFDLLKAYSFC